MTDIIKLTGVSKQYEGDGQQALHDVSFAVAEGELVCLVGPSGCGKTSVLKLIAGLDEPTTGTLERPAEVAMAFQSAGLFPWLTVFENTALGLRERGLGEDELKRRVDRELAQVGMTDFTQKYPADLSGGQRQRVGIARALAVDPKVLILDEPFSALDPKTTAELHDDLIRIWRDTGKTIVMVSHLIEEAVSLADRVILMREGTVDEIFTIDLPYPRRESEGFHKDVMKVRRAFFR